MREKKTVEVRIPDGKGGVREVVGVDVEAEYDILTDEWYLDDDAIRKIDGVKRGIIASGGR